MTNQRIRDDKTRVSFILDKEKLKEFDDYAKSKGLTRTAFLTVLIYESLENKKIKEVTTNE